jgi:hypothetical protein
MGKVLQSNHSYEDNAKHILESMKMRLFQLIIELDFKCGVMIDESNTSTFLCDLVELNNTSASTLLDTMLWCLHKHGLIGEYILRNAISFAADGASDI